MKRLALPLLAITLITTACAPIGGPGGPDGERPEKRGMRGGDSAMLITDVQARLLKAESALQLSSDQLPLWNAYQERVGALMADQLKPLPQYAQHTALQQIGQKVSTASNRLAALENIQDAASALYVALDDVQQQTADRLLPSTVPTLYSGLESGGENERKKERSGGRGGPGGGGGGGRM